MILFLLIDLKVDDWQLTTRDLFNDIVVFLNAYHKSSRSNRVMVVSSRKILFDSLNDNISDIYRITESGCTYDVGDLGYVLCIQRGEQSEVVIFTLRNERKTEYLKYLKCMFAAKRLKVRINAFSLFDNKTISKCCASTGGSYSTSEEECLRFLFLILGTGMERTPIEFRTECYCHNEQILLGFVCPVCLAIFCKFVPVCKKCKSKFNFTK